MNFDWTEGQVDDIGRKAFKLGLVLGAIPACIAFIVGLITSNCVIGFVAGYEVMRTERFGPQGKGDAL